MPETAGELWDQWKDIPPDSYALLEKVNSYPVASVRSAFTFGQEYGKCRTLLAVLERHLGLHWTLVTPQRWQKGLRIEKRKKSEKQAAFKKRLIQVAEAAFPYLPDWQQTQTHKLTIADAVLVAKYCKLTRRSIKGAKG